MKVATCKRCGVQCQISPIPGSEARMLKRANQQGLCLNCAVHDTLRYLYPMNLQLARSGPKGLLDPESQRMFFDICVAAGTDARFEDIDWQRVVANWNLPFPTKIKRTATNPVTQEDLDREAAEGATERREGWKPPLTAQEQRAKRRAELDHGQRTQRDKELPK